MSAGHTLAAFVVNLARVAHGRDVFAASLLETDGINDETGFLLNENVY